MATEEQNNPVEPLKSWHKGEPISARKLNEPVEALNRIRPAVASIKNAMGGRGRLPIIIKKDSFDADTGIYTGYIQTPDTLPGLKQATVSTKANLLKYFYPADAGESTPYTERQDDYVTGFFFGVESGVAYYCVAGGTVTGEVANTYTYRLPIDAADAFALTASGGVLTLTIKYKTVTVKTDSDDKVIAITEGAQTSMTATHTGQTCG